MNKLFERDRIDRNKRFSKIEGLLDNFSKSHRLDKENSGPNDISSDEPTLDVNRQRFVQRYRKQNESALPPKGQ